MNGRERIAFACAEQRRLLCDLEEKSGNFFSLFFFSFLIFIYAPQYYIPALPCPCTSTKSYLFY